MSARRAPRPDPDAWSTPQPSSTGEVQVVPDRSRPGGWTVLVNGVPSSYVDLDDPLLLVFEYMQWMAVVLDAWGASAHAPLRVVHLGGAGCTLARYVHATRPGSSQEVFEIDETVVTMARQAFGLRALPGVRLRTADGRAALQRLPAASVDVVIRDAFDVDQVPRHLTTVEYHQEVARVLRPDGVHLANAADNAAVRESRSEAAAALKVFTDVAMVAEPGQLRGRRRGNVVIASSPTPIPAERLVRGLASGVVRARYVPREEVQALVAGQPPARDPAGTLGD